MINDKGQTSYSLDALRDGDRAEFARIVEQYSPMIYRLGLKMLNNPQDAEDILQETFIKAYRHIHKFDGRSSVSTWLYRIATNEALMSLRKKRPDIISFDMPPALSLITILMCFPDLPMFTLSIPFSSLYRRPCHMAFSI